jgi:hypothetical protein
MCEVGLPILLALPTLAQYRVPTAMPEYRTLRDSKELTLDMAGSWEKANVNKVYLCSSVV